MHNINKNGVVNVSIYTRFEYIIPRVLPSKCILIIVSEMKKYRHPANIFYKRRKYGNKILL